MSLIHCFALSLFVCLPLAGKFPQDFSKPLHRIAFGSCNRHDLPQPLWPVIANNKPDLWIWLGDNVYGDTEDMMLLKEKYDAQKALPGYATFARHTSILATWDDHDYGANNSGSSYPKKAESAKLALDFADVPAEDPRRAREGIYGSYTFGPPGKQVKVILVDDRYFSEKPGKNADLLGKAQWDWLKQELLTSKAQINLIATGIQFIAPDHKYEKWANFPISRQGLLDFIRKKGIPGVVFISGDRHIHEISLKNDEETPYPLVDVTSSGLTHTWENFPGEANRHRVGRVHDTLGFGLITLDWEATPATICFEIRNADNRVVNQLILPIKSLSPTQEK